MRAIGRLGLRFSVIVTTYNSPRALALVLAGLERQSEMGFEVLIADDGSAEPAVSFVRDYADSAPFPVRHVWHADRGFRKCAITNRAIERAAGDYMMVLDGDCIPPPHLIAMHAREARRGCYVAGGKVFLDRDFSAQLTPRCVTGGVLERAGGWWWSGIEKNRRRLIISRLAGLRLLFDRNLQRRRWHWRGENSSTFIEHAHAVGGFDERMSYGGEDLDFGLRLEAAGIRCRSIRYRAPVFHLHHERPYADAAAVRANVTLRERNLAEGKIVTPHGLARESPEPRSDPAVPPAPRPR